ncbi:MAG: ABC transporter permease subunit [Actinomycetota bacterium]
MIRLVGSELRRFLARRLVRWLVVLAALGIAIAGIVVAADHHRLSGPEQKRIAAVQSAQLRACLDGQFGPAPPGETLKEFCQSLAGHFHFVVLDPQFHLTSLPNVFRGTEAAIVVLAFLLAASFVGLEWHSGTMAVLLTWEPRRWRVFGAKTAAALLIAFVGTILLLVALGLALLPAALFRGTTTGVDAAWIRETAGVLLRAGLLSAIGAAAGFAVASAARNTAASLGVGFGYMVVVESLLGALKPAWRHWMVVPNSIVLLVGNDAVTGIRRTAVGAGILLSVYAAMALVAAGVVFARRDVT